MELKLVNGDYVAGRRLGLEAVGGAEELAQRITMKLTSRRGGFAPLPEYGSRLHLLRSVKPSERETAARQYILEALRDEQGLELNGFSMSDGEDGSVAVDLMFTYREKQAIGVKTVI